MKRIFLLALAIVWVVPSTALAQWDPFPNKNMPRTADGKVNMNAPPQRMADGKPDFRGFWMPNDNVRHLLNLATDMKAEDVPLTEWGKSVYAERIETNGKDHPGVRCLPSGIPEKLNIPDGLKVVDTPDLLLHNNGRENGSDGSYGSQSLTCSWRLRWQGSGQRRPGASARRVKVKERPGAMLAYPSPEGGTPRGASVASAVDSKRISRTLLAAPVSWVRHRLVSR